MLGIPADFPIGAFRKLGQSSGEFTFIKRENNVQQHVMQEGCILGHPDPDHYMQKHIHLIQSHSNQVMATASCHVQCWHPGGNYHKKSLLEHRICETLLK
jgi:hypothetical protein